MELHNNISLLKEWYQEYNLRGCLDESDKIRIDTSLKRVPKKIGHKVDDIVDTIFDSELKFILEDEGYRDSYKLKTKKILERFEVAPTAYRAKIMTNYKFMVVPFINAITYPYKLEEQPDMIRIFFPKKGFKNQQESIIDNIFKWLEKKYPEIELWSNIDSKNLYDWRKVNKPVIISAESIINLKRDLKRYFVDDKESNLKIEEKDLEAFVILLFFGRVIWKNYLEVSRRNPLVNILLNLMYLKVKKDEKERDEPIIYYKRDFSIKNYLSKNLKNKDELISDIIKESSKKNKILLEIYYSNKKYEDIEKVHRNLKDMTYSEIKKNYKSLLEIKNKSNVENMSRIFIGNYILFYALSEKDNKFCNRFYNEFKYKIPFIIENLDGDKEEYKIQFDELKKEVYSQDILTLTFIEGVIFNKDVLFEEPSIRYWVIKNTNIIKLMPEIVALKIKSKFVKYPYAKNK